MPTIQENKSFWDEQYDWEGRGDEWSEGWGGPTMQWFGTILPRMHRFLPAEVILEIAPGFGRWTEFLKDQCRSLILVDVSAKCIDACRRRFAACSHINYFVNDGKSLEMVRDNSIDFAFSFDSLVHVEDVVMDAYVSQLGRKLKRDGAAFLHHSNLGDEVLVGAGEATHGRDPSMTHQKAGLYASRSGLTCISQELINWGTKEALIDCFSTLAHVGSSWSKEDTVWRNDAFKSETEYILKLSRLYAR